MLVEHLIALPVAGRLAAIAAVPGLVEIMLCEYADPWPQSLAQFSQHFCTSPTSAGKERAKRQSVRKYQLMHGRHRKYGGIFAKQGTMTAAKATSNEPQA
ncbi:MAG: hypothetical protein GC182_21795 [Rhodopseudomonas sp.]|nr:hypothetical protein [Rhodopseudomonas sp.]